MLLELPVDVAHACFWRTGRVPTVFRVLIGESSIVREFKSLLAPQYFEWPPLRRVVDHSCSNPCDVFVHCREVRPLRSFFSFLWRLHDIETKYASTHTNSQLGSGGRLMQVPFAEHKIITSVSGWRRVDWLVTSQIAIFPREWNIDIEKVVEDLTSLLDYRRWNERRKLLGLHALESADIPRVFREKMWSEFQIAAPAATTEPVQLRISPSDTATVVTAARAFQRSGLYRESLALLNDVEISTEVAYLKAIAQLQLVRSATHRQAVIFPELHHNCTLGNQ